MKKRKKQRNKDKRQCHETLTSKKENTRSFPQLHTHLSNRPCTSIPFDIVTTLHPFDSIIISRLHRRVRLRMYHSIAHFALKSFPLPDRYLEMRFDSSSRSLDGNQRRDDMRRESA